MGVGAGLSMYVVVVQKFTFVISSSDEFLFIILGLKIGNKKAFFGRGASCCLHEVTSLCIKQFMNGKNKICSELYGIKVCQKLCKLVQLF